MKAHQIVYENIKTILKDYFGDEIKEYEAGEHMTIGNTGVWLSSDEYELTIGHGINHRHYHCEINNMNDAIDEFINILTRRKRITNTYKGKYLYKSETEIENQNGDFIVLSSSLSWYFPFWKKTKIETHNIGRIIDSQDIIRQIEELKKYF
ncbi:MAG: hypothetical protein IT221_04505 [Fluviicola sp.]|nr:hypothetical protein [Fluviicola sp.]